MQSRVTEKVLAALQPDLDPECSLGTQKLSSACKACGFDIADIDPAFADQGLAVDPRVPKERTQQIEKHRKDIREGLRQQRVHQVRDELVKLTDDGVRRLERCGKDGVRPISPTDLPPAEELSGMDKIQALQEKQLEDVKRQQARKATSICSEFLMGKKRAEEADAQIKALDDRLKENRKQRELMYKARRAELVKAQERRQQQADKAHKDRDDYEDEVERKATERLNAARARRAQTYSTENLKSKTEESNAKRECAYVQAADLQAQQLLTIQTRQEAKDRQLNERWMAKTEEMERRCQESHEKFVQKQVAVCALQREWAENKLKKHGESVKHFEDCRTHHRDELKAYSRSVGDMTKKSMDKWQAAYSRCQVDKSSNDDALMARLQAANDKVDNVLKPMKLKCGRDVFSHIEVKEKTFGDLVQRRLLELRRAQDAKTQSLLIKLAERQRKDETTKAGHEQVRKQRTESTKEILRYSNEASQVFLKIKSEPNETRIRQAMAGLGFKMPRIGGEDDEDGGTG